jgi:ABC-type Zn2+ transport system substrate-binding protein/surface adhesin
VKFAYSHPTAALQFAAKEAWMSINPVHLIAARLRFGITVKRRVWAARGARRH